MNRRNPGINVKTLLYFILSIYISSVLSGGSMKNRSLSYYENNAFFKYNLIKLEKDNFRLNLTVFKNNTIIASSDLYLYHSIKQFFSADINNDGRQEIAVGIIKKTRYDKAERLRPFFYKISDNAIVPLWLGSKLGRSLIDFKPVRISSQIYIKTLENSYKNKYSVLLFKWYNFGFKFVKYIEKDNIYQKAKKSFTED